MKGCTYCFIHKEAHTNEHFISCDGHQLYAFKERGIDLKVEGVRCALENGADLYVNERQKIRHYRARSTEERIIIIIMPNRYFLLRVVHT